MSKASAKIFSIALIALLIIGFSEMTFAAVYPDSPDAEDSTVVSTDSKDYVTLKTLTVAKDGQAWLKTVQEFKSSNGNPAYIRIISSSDSSIYCEDTTTSTSYQTSSCELDISSLSDGSQSFELQMKIQRTGKPYAVYNRLWELYLEEVESTTTTTVEPFPGNLSATLERPPEGKHSNLTQGLFDMVAKVACLGGSGAYCGGVQAQARHNDSTGMTGISDQQGDTPFYIVSSNTTLNEVGIKDYDWFSSSPQGMVQEPGYDTFLQDGLTFNLRGYEQMVEVTDSNTTLSVKPKNGDLYPINFLTESSNFRSTAWYVTPLSDLWYDKIVWSDGTEDTGKTMYHVLENGLLNVYSNSNQSVLELQSSAPIHNSSNIYTTGNMRVRVIKGYASVSSNTLTISPSAGEMQIVVYARNFFDDKPVNVLGALTTEYPGEVVETTGYVKQKHARVQAGSIDKYLAVDPVNFTDTGLLYRYENPTGLADAVSISMAGDTFTYPRWHILVRAVKNIKSDTYIRANRRIQYEYLKDVDSYLTGQTFNFYVFTDIGTQTLWSVGRIREPYSVYHYPDGKYVFHFPKTNYDHSEHGVGIEATTTKATWAFDDSTGELIEGLEIKANMDLEHTGEEGQSIDGGWRHVTKGTATEKGTKYRDSSGSWVLDSTIRTSWPYYLYPEGNGAFAIMSDSDSVRAYAQQRHWSGYWENRADQVAFYNHQDNKIYFGSMKDLHNDDITPAGSVMEMSTVYRGEATSDVPTDSEAESYYQNYVVPDGVAMTDGLVNLSSSSANTNSDWDVGYLNGEPRLFSAQESTGCDSVTYDQACIVGWKVNATGPLGSGHLLDAFITALDTQFSNTETGDAEVTIVTTTTTTTTTTTLADYCGDGYCAGQAEDEDCYTCPDDCICIGPNCKNACCGNGVCDRAEDSDKCPVDCS